LPIALFSMLRLGLTPEVNALAALVVLGVGAMLGLGCWLLRARRA
ncbi:MAG: putrescine ABC transporter permease PotI, partial [Acetobacteraceae bacterium]|nr:putrescine ABC transporter permease PotI [Acetobacteraceae bacterium]